MKKEGKSVRESSTVMTQLMYPQDANPAGNVHGGTIMKLIDTAAGVVAVRHCRTNVVTASIDRLDLLRPVYIGNLVTIKASLNMVGKTGKAKGLNGLFYDRLAGPVVPAYKCMDRLELPPAQGAFRE
jgi:uncharacterized protein (TIGR00369 family)